MLELEAEIVKEKDSPIGEKLFLPANEAQVRAVFDLDPEDRLAVWKQAAIELGPDQITAKTISREVEKYKVKHNIVKVKPEPKKQAKAPSPAITS